MAMTRPSPNMKGIGRGDTEKAPLPNSPKATQVINPISSSSAITAARCKSFHRVLPVKWAQSNVPIPMATV